MRIGVVTFYWSEDNYGQLLQAYALQRYLREAGHDAFLIRYEMNDDLMLSTRWQLVRRGLGQIGPLRILWHFLRGDYTEWKQNEHRDFDGFRQKYLKFSSRRYRRWRQLQARPPEADCYIVGSDQVWNFTLFSQGDARQQHDVVHAFFLDFGASTTLRMSYAASWSVASLRPDFIAEITPLLQRFTYVSVREQNGIGLCAACGREDAQWVPDPTLLLPAEDYRAMYRQEPVSLPQRPYLFIYVLSDDYRITLQEAQAWAEARGWDVVCVTGNGFRSGLRESPLTIPEWLACLDGAGAVLTNSFHCAVFATLFRTPFGVAPREGECAGMNSRLDTLFSLTGQPARYIRDTRDFSWLTVAVEPRLDFDQGDLARMLSGMEKKRTGR